jgi:hypothetical protein
MGATSSHPTQRRLAGELRYVLHYLASHMLSTFSAHYIPAGTLGEVWCISVLVCSISGLYVLSVKKRAQAGRCRYVSAKSSI